MRTDPKIDVFCDREDCGYCEEVELTALSRSAYDERNVDDTLRDEGWRIDDDEDVCPDCVALEAAEGRR